MYSPQVLKEAVLEPQKFWQDDDEEDAGVGRGRECGIKVKLVVSYPSKCLGANGVVLTVTSCVGVYLHTSGWAQKPEVTLRCCHSGVIHLAF